MAPSVIHAMPLEWWLRPLEMQERLGEQTDAVLRGLGYDEAQVAALKEAGAVAGPVSGAQGSFMA